MPPDGGTPEWATSHQVLGMILEFRRGQSGLIVMYTSTRRGTFPGSSITLAVPIIHADMRKSKPPEES
jgi:hypothetical protein